MKQKVGWLILLATIFLVGCKNDSKEAKDKKDTSHEDTTKIVLASADSDAQIWKFIASSEAAKQAGLEIQVEEITGGPQLNNVVAEGQADINAFQSLGYLLSFNRDSQEKLVPIATTYIEPMGIYSDKYASIEEIKEGSEVALADNPANTARGLRLLETAGLVKLKEDFDNGTGTPSDIVSNPKKLTFKLIDDTTGPRILEDVDLALISNTVAYEGGLNVLKDAIFKEEVDDSTKLSINVLAVREDQKNNKEFQKLAELYHSSEVKAYIQKHFGGTKVDVQKDIQTLWEEVQ